MNKISMLTALAVALAIPAAWAQTTPPAAAPAAAGRGQGRGAPLFTPTQGDFKISDFKFADGESLPDLNIHYYTLGTPQKDASGRTTNAVLILHGTGGSGASLINARSFAGVLFVPGGLLDATKYYIISPDGIGHGKSSKPSDGLHAKFPHYGYHDMVTADYMLLTQHLGVNHLRLVMGTSMGGMQSWMFPEMYPDFMDAAMPLASLPVQLAGRNREFRRMVIDSITLSPDYDGGEYKTQPFGLRTAIYTLLVMTSSPKDMQKSMPTKEATDAAFDRSVNADLRTEDANDMLYQFAASGDYNPEPELGKIKCYLVAVNSADDQVNPPEVGELTMVPDIKKVAHGEYVLIPIGPETRGHGTHTIANVWKDHLAHLLDESAH